MEHSHRPRAGQTRHAAVSSEAKDRSEVPALDRGLDLLEQMALAAEPLSLTQIALAAGCSVSEVQRSVACLKRRSYLVRDARGHYYLGSKLFRLVNTHPPFRDLIARAMPAMNDYTDATGESVELGVLSTDLLLLVAQAEGRGFARLRFRLGVAQDPIAVVAGRILLAALSQEELAAFSERRKLLSKEADRLRQACNAIRERGYESAPNESVQGVHHVGVPVLLPTGRVLAALTSSFLLLRAGGKSPFAQLAPLHVAARAIAQAYEPLHSRR